MEIQKHDIDYIKREIGEVKQNVTSMLQILKGHELDKTDTGIIGRVDSIEGRVTKLERVFDRGKYLIIGMALPAGYGITEFLVKIFL